MSGKFTRMRIFVLLPLIIILGISFSFAQDAKPELRTWTAVNGKEVEAEFVSNEKGVVKLKLKLGKVFEVPLNKLSKADQDFLKAKSSSVKPVSAEPPSKKPSESPKSLSDADVERLLKEAVDYELLEGRDGLFYQNNEPYSGWVKAMYASGQAEGLCQLKDGKQDGLEMRWHENGQKSYEETYKDGKMDGLALRWHENGQKAAEANVKNDKLISVKYWNSKGEPVDSAEEARINP